MARNPAMKKAAKAAKRKAVVAAKRKMEIAAGSLGGRVGEAARQPVLQCLVSENLFGNGMGTITLVPVEPGGGVKPNRPCRKGERPGAQPGL